MVKTGDVTDDGSSSASVLCTSIIVSASQPRYCTAGNTRDNVDDDDGLSPAIINCHLLVAAMSTGMAAYWSGCWSCDSEVAGQTRFQITTSGKLFHQAV